VRAEMGKILKVIEIGAGPDREYAIGIEPISMHVGANGAFLGSPCRTFEEMQNLASEIRSDLENLLPEAQVKMAYDLLKRPSI
jgi:hypothetical protein